MMNPSMLPLGFIFSPTDEELLSHYLYYKIVGEYNPPFTPPMIDLYSQEPCAIWQQFGGIDGQDFHCFTMLKKKKSRIVRKVGSNGGTWSGENKANLVYSSANDAFIGTFKRFHYENPKLKVSDEDCSWIMYEYTLDPSSVPKGIIHDSYVLCKIRKKIVKKVKKAVVPAPIQTFAYWPTTASMKEYDHNPQPVENQSWINMDMVFTEDEIKELLDCNDLESTEYEKDIQPSTDNQSAEMCAMTQIELYDQNPKRRKLVEMKDLENQICNNKEDERELLQWNGLESVVPLKDVIYLTDHNQYDEMWPSRQTEFWDQIFYPVEPTNPSAITQMKLYDQNLNNEELANLCEEFYDQSSKCVEPADTLCSTTQMESHDQILDVETFVKDLKSTLQQCNKVEPTNVEKVSSYDNEWYWN